MPLDRHDAARVYDMLLHAQRVVLAVQGRDERELTADITLRYSIERLSEIIGEAARKVSRTAQNDHPEIPWKKIVQQRHIMAHDYGDIRLDILWRIATIHIPALIPQLEAILPEPPADPLPEPSLPEDSQP